MLTFAAGAYGSSYIFISPSDRLNIELNLAIKIIPITIITELITASGLIFFISILQTVYIPIIFPAALFVNLILHNKKDTA